MSGGKHCYSNSDVLINKYNIREKDLLEKLEIQKVTVKLLGLDLRPERIPYTYDIKHLVNINKYLFGDIYEWAGEFRDEDLYKSERVLSGGSAQYSDYKNINKELKSLLNSFNRIDLKKADNLSELISDFLLDLWSIHPFREGNTRTCITFIWHYLMGKGINFQVELLRNNPMYVRDSLVMANYDIKKHLNLIVGDALSIEESQNVYSNIPGKEQYQIAKQDYDTFKEKYSIKK